MKLSNTKLSNSPALSFERQQALWAWYQERGLGASVATPFDVSQDQVTIGNCKCSGTPKASFAMVTLAEDFEQERDFLLKIGGALGYSKEQLLVVGIAAQPQALLNPQQHPLPQY